MSRTVVTLHAPAIAKTSRETASRPCYSATLLATLSAPVSPVFGGDGLAFKAQPWQAPQRVPEDVRREAIHALGLLNTTRGAPQVGQEERFVAHLAALCAGRELPPEEKLTAAVSAILRGDYPAAMFLDASFLDRAARRFSWWPSWAELAPVLDEERDRLRVQEERLTIIAKGGAGAQRREEAEEPWTGPRRLSAETEALLENWRRNPPPGPEPLRPRLAAGPSR